MDFVYNLSDAMEKKPKDVLKILDIETDEAQGVKIPPKKDMQNVFFLVLIEFRRTDFQLFLKGAPPPPRGGGGGGGSNPKVSGSHL